MTGNSDQQFLLERGFGLEIGFGERPAVLVIDLINGFTDPTTPLGAPLDDVIDATKLILTTARGSGIPILFTTVAYEDPEFADAGVWARKQTGVRSLRDGTRNVAVDERLGQLPGEPTLKKKYASAFFGTDLVSRLVIAQVDTLVLVGCTTSGCIRATAVDGIQNGFRVTVVREAVGDRVASAHIQSLIDLDAKYADVRSLDQVIAYLKGVEDRGNV